MEKLQLFIVLLGGYNKGDLLESHNLFVAVGSDIVSLKPQMKKSWPGTTHVDAYMILEQADGFDIRVKEGIASGEKFPKLVIANIGYYKAGEFAEFHKLIPVVLKDERDSIIGKMKRDPDFAGGQHLDESTRSHIDDKHVVTAFDIDDVIDVQKNIPGYVIELLPSEKKLENILKLGYQFTDLKKM
jgi:hypothetical protein